jgi:hypothetical protein
MIQEEMFTIRVMLDTDERLSREAIQDIVKESLEGSTFLLPGSKVKHAVIDEVEVN